MSSSAIPIPTFSSASLQALLQRPKLRWDALVSTLNVESFAILAATRNVSNKFHVDPYVEGVVICRFGVECDRKECTFYHPGGRAIDYDIEPQEDNDTATASTEDVSPTSPDFDDSLVTAPAPISYLFDSSNPSSAPISSENVSPSLSYSSPTSSESTSPSLSPIESPHAVATNTRPCRYGNGCLNPACPYLHPVLPHSASAEFGWGFQPQHTQTHMQSSPSPYVSPVPSPEYANTYSYLVHSTSTSSESDEADDTDFSPPQSATCAPITAATAQCAPSPQSSRRRGNRAAGWHLKSKGSGSGGSSRRSRRKQRFWAQQQQQYTGYSSSTTSSECSSASPSPPASPVMRYSQQTRNLLSRGMTTQVSSASSSNASQSASQASYASPARACVSGPAAAISSHATTTTSTAATPSRAASATVSSRPASTLNSASATFTPGKSTLTRTTTQQQQQQSSPQRAPPPSSSVSNSPSLPSRSQQESQSSATYASVTSSASASASHPHHHQHAHQRARSKKRTTDCYAPASSEIDMLNKTFSFSRSRGFA